MKVALLSDCYLPRLGGIEVQVHDLAARLRDRGHEVEVFTATPGPHGERHGVVDQVDGVPVHRLALRLPWELPVNPFAPPELRRRLSQGGFDVAHVHMGVVSPFAVDAARVTTGLGLPTAMTWHCMLGALEPALRAAGFVRGGPAGGVAMNAVSGVAAEPLRRLVGDAGQVAVLPNGIDVARWAAPAAGPRRRPGDGVRLVTAMRLAGRKRPEPCCTPCAACVTSSGPPYRCTWRCSVRGRAAAGWSGTSTGTAWRAWCRCPAGSRATSCRTGTPAPTSTSPPAGSSRSASPPWRRGPPGFRSSADRGTGVGEFVKDGVNGYLAAGRRGDGARRGPAGAGRRPARADGGAQPRAPARGSPGSTSCAGAEAEYARALSLAGVR